MKNEISINNIIGILKSHTDNTIAVEIPWPVWPFEFKTKRIIKVDFDISYPLSTLFENHDSLKLIEDLLFLETNINVIILNYDGVISRYDVITNTLTLHESMTAMEVVRMFADIKNIENVSDNNTLPLSILVKKFTELVPIVEDIIISSESNDFNKYHYVYKPSLGSWSIAKNPVFIAEHTHCRAVKKEEYPDISVLLKDLNEDRLVL